MVTTHLFCYSFFDVGHELGAEADWILSSIPPVVFIFLSRAAVDKVYLVKLCLYYRVEDFNYVNPVKQGTCKNETERNSDIQIPLANLEPGLCSPLSFSFLCLCSLVNSATFIGRSDNSSDGCYKRQVK